MNVRLRRLKADYERIGPLFGARSRIRILKTLGSPPEKYQVEFLVTSLQKDLATQQLKTHNSFLAEIALTAAYPQMAPQCRMLTPVFHPNIAPHAICIGDHWAAGESLANLVVRIAEMLAYQSYNVKSPLNGEAARWVERHKADLPLDPFDFASLLSVGEAAALTPDGTARPGEACGNCGKRPGPGEPPLKVCANRHVACDECLIECPICHRDLCLKCPRETCAVCGRAACAKCVFRCDSCRQVVCLEHTAKCHVCGRLFCANCATPCEACGKPTCVAHIVKVEAGGAKKYVCTDCAA